MRPRTPTELRLGTHAGCPSSWDQAWGRAEARLLPAGPRSNSTGGDQPGTWREGLIPASNPGLRLPESEAGASARPALPARSWNWVGRRNQGLRRGIPAALPAARGRGGPGQGDPAGGRRGAPAPSAAATSSIFPVFGAFPLGPLALPPVIGAPAPSPGFPKGGTSLSPPPPPPPPGHLRAVSQRCPRAGGGAAAGGGVPEDGAEVDARRSAAARRPLPPGTLSSRPRRPRSHPSPGPAPTPSRPLPPTRTPRLAAGAPGLGPPRREGFAGRAGAREPAGEEGGSKAAPRAPPPPPPARLAGPSSRRLPPPSSLPL